MMVNAKTSTNFLLICVSSFSFINCTILQEELVSKWASKIGDELWKLGEATTKFKEIQGSYSYFNAQVETKDLERSLKEVVEDIERMMDRKNDAIKCIQETAEKAAELYQYNSSYYYYYSSKYSSTKDAAVELPESLVENSDMYLNLTDVNVDTHFYNLAVDTNLSSVHVPTNLHDRHNETAFEIQWSEALNEVFIKNYNADPALSWQYFGSSSGIMRLYPAKKWQYDFTTDEFDCRVRTWYIEAATCTKDVIILVDNSGSMDGIGKHIAKLTVLKILDTLSNNDYVNVLYYNTTTNYTVPCFEKLLVQATPENIWLFKQQMEELKPMGKTNASQALEVAFQILETYRIKRGCQRSPDGTNDGASSCNQAIMIITDGIAKNLSDIVLRDNDNQEVRIFAYLIGELATNVPEFLWMACANRGYFTQVKTLEQVNTAVLQYINVVARPLVLQAKDHPTSWTHAYVDPSYDDTRDEQINEPYRLVTSAAVPAFDKRINGTKQAKLLGVAGTDVPINDIEKLTLPYKLGVNAYAFIVSNNGYVLMHRDLRPMFKGVLRKNYNSIDLVEVEQFDNELEERHFSPNLIDLRSQIVSGKTGKVLGIPIKYHYDDMKRVTRDDYDFYWAPLKETPFSLAFAVPDGYGHYSLLVRDEITNDRHKPGANITDYFRDSNWKIHPKWVYCRYHYLEGHEFETPEDELLHFLGKMYRDDFIWEKQYEANLNENITIVDCGRKTHENDDYYCDRQLVQRLVFDAKNTFGAFESSTWKSDYGLLITRFNVTLRFVATMSGLTRWEYISKEIEDNTERKFENLHAKAIDETWYKSAVIQHRYDPESFVYSVPFNSEGEEDMLVTASYAIFPSDAGKTAPGSVVGYQFIHKKLTNYILNLTSVGSTECEDCRTCQTDLTCYVIDNNGYIIVSEDVKQTGRFFGQIEIDVMASMVEESIFENVTIYDYQAICSPENDHSNKADSLPNILGHFTFLVDWIVVKMLDLSLFDLWLPRRVHADDEEDDDDVYYDCDKKRSLYMLQQRLFLRNDYVGEIRRENGKNLHYYINKIPHSNLLFVAINDTLFRRKGNLNSEDATEAKKVIYENGLDNSCQKLKLNNLERRRLTGCYNEHPLEEKIKICGFSPRIKANFVLFPYIIFFNLYMFN